MRPTCWFAQLPGASPCEGRLIRAHLLPKQLLRREFKEGAVLIDGTWQRPIEAEFLPGAPPLRRTLRELQDDPRAFVPACGGLVGLAGHHGLYDGGRLPVERSQLPPEVEAYALELGLVWWLEKHFAA